MTTIGCINPLNEAPPRHRYYGKYRGVVIENEDPEVLGRLMVFVDSITSTKGTWALPCVPYAGEQVGIFFKPPTGANVWVEFEGGDPRFPIWTGCFWAEGEMPPEAEGPGVDVVLQMPGIQLILSEEAGFTLLVEEPAATTPCQILINDSGIEIACEPSVIRIGSDSIEITSNDINATAELTTVNGDILNNGATEITADLTVGGAAEVGADLAVGGAAEVGADLAVGGAAEVGVDLAVGGAAEVGIDLAVGGAIEVGVDLTVVGNGQFLLGLEVGLNLAVGGAIEAAACVAAGCYP